MLTGIFAVILLALCAWSASVGVQTALNDPVQLALGLLCILVLFVIYRLPNSNVAKMMTIEKGPFWNLERSIYRLPVAVFFLILSLGNFVYANSNFFMQGRLFIYYVFAILLALLAFNLVKKK